MSKREPCHCGLRVGGNIDPDDCSSPLGGEGQCLHCGATLTPAELHWYGVGCDDCEGRLTPVAHLRTAQFIRAMSK